MADAVPSVIGRCTRAELHRHGLTAEDLAAWPQADLDEIESCPVFRAGMLRGIAEGKWYDQVRHAEANRQPVPPHPLEPGVDRHPTPDEFRSRHQR